MARLLMIGGGRRGRWLAGTFVADGHAARIITRRQEGRAAIERIGAECWIGDPNRLATAIGALEGVTIACWLLGTAAGPAKQLQALHQARLAAFLGEAVDTTVRGFVYEAAGTVPADLLATGAETATTLAASNAIPLRVLDADPADEQRWRAQAQNAISDLLAAR